MNEAQKALKPMIEPLLREQGFTGSPHSGFKRKTEFGFHCLSLPGFAWRAGGPYEVRVGLGIRHNRVDDIVNRLGHIWGEDNRSNTTTIYRGLEHFPFDSVRDRVATIHSERLETESRDFSEKLARMLAQDGLDFFERYSSLLECSEGLNRPVASRTHELHNNFELRAYYGVAVAAFAQPERVPILIRDYTDYARDNAVTGTIVFEVGKELSGADALQARLKFVAEAAFSNGA
jgi:hypothetical protein